MEVTLEEVNGAVTELREELKKNGVDQSKIERIQTFLDTAEEKNQALVTTTQLGEQHKADITELKDALGKAGVNAGEARERVDALELELARGRGVLQEADFRDSDEYKAVNRFCREGINSLDAEEKATLRTDSFVDGGVLVPHELDTELVKKITEIDPIRTITRVRSTGAKSIELPIRNVIPTATYEGEADTGGDSNSTYQSETVTPFRQTYTAPITMDQLMDAQFDMSAEIAADAGEAFGFGEGNGFVVGTGFKQPEGFAANAALQTAARETAASAVLDPNAIILLTGDLKVGYNPVYVLNRRTLALIRTFRGDAASAGDQAGQYLWQPGLNGPIANTLNGFPYVLANSMPDVAASAFAMAFGDFRRGYTIVDRTGMSVIRDEFTLKKKAIVEFTMNRWNTGRVTLEEAIKLLKIKA